MCFTVLTSDSLSYHIGQSFSTYDNDADSCGCNCADKDGGGGFWFDNCFKLNPNGLYKNDNTRESMCVTDWSTYRSASEWKMMTRRIY